MNEQTILLPAGPAGQGQGANYELRMMLPKRHYRAYLRERWWLLLLFQVLTVGGVICWETVRTGRFQSFAQLYVAGEVPVVATGTVADDSPTFLGTQVELLKSARLRANAARAAGLPEPPPGESSPFDIEILQPQRTSILLLQATGPDPTQTQEFLRALVEEYMSFKRMVRQTNSQEVLAMVAEELAEKDRELEGEQQRYLDFQRTNNLAVLEEDGKSLGLRLTELSMQLDKAKLQRDLLQKGVNPVVAADTAGGGGSATSWAAAVSTNLAGATADLTLKQSRVQLAVLREEKTNKVSTLHLPERALQKLNEEIERLETTVAVLEAQNEAQRKSDLEEVEKRIDSIQATLPTLEVKVKDINDRLSQGLRLKLNVQQKQSVIERLVPVVLNVDLHKNVPQEKVALLQAATTALPEKRYLPVRILVAVAAGLLLSLGFALVWYLADDRLVSGQDLRDQFGERLLGLVPRVRMRRSQPAAALVQAADRRPGYAEAFRQLRSALLLSAADGRPPQTLLVTGTMPAEGRTTVAANLARVLAQCGRRVTLLDADTRSHARGLPQLLGLNPQPGLLDALRQQDLPPGSLLQETGVPGLTFIACGTPDDTAEDLLLQPQLGRLMNQLKGTQDFLIIDAPPVLTADPAALLAPHADLVVLVVRPFFTRSRWLRQTLDMLYQRQARQVALVLNRAGKDDLAGHGRRKGA